MDSVPSTSAEPFIGPVDPVNVVNTNETYVRRFRVHGRRTTFKFNSPPEGVSEIDWLRGGFSSLVEKMKAESEEGDQLGFTLRSLNLKNKEPGYVAFRPAAQVDEDVLWEIFGGIVQSNAESITSADTFQVECTRVNLPVGTGRVRPGMFNTFNEECHKRKGIVAIKNTDNLCLPRAIVVAKAKVKNNPEFQAIRKDRRGRQLNRARKLMQKARVEIPEEGAGILELQKFQDHLKKYKITVYHYDRRGRDVYFEGNNPDASLKINLLFHNGHYNVITSLTAAFACTHFCEGCHVPYSNKGNHRCNNICSACQTVSPPCIEEMGGIVCPECNLKYKNQICFLAHKNERCKSVRKCKDCDKIINLNNRKSDHVCGEVFCVICREFLPPDHQCYMKVDKRKPTDKIKDSVYIFFDLETRQDEPLATDPDSNLHIVNLCISQQYCWKCIEGEGCDTCNDRTKIFREDPVGRFVDYVMESRKQFKNVCAIAHNGQGFDFQFILKHIIEHTKFTPELIMRGTKVILLEVDSVRFIDSLNYFPMALSALPKAFDLPPEKKKGYFPHLFNTMANQNFVGPIPSKKFYCPDTMFEKTYKDFENWHNEQMSQNYVFDFSKEIVEYCLSDVDILAQACIKFRKLFLLECNVEPFLEAVTIASACNLAFRRNFLKPNTIGLIPKNGYRMVENQSAIALQWMTWEEGQRDVTINHAGRGRESRIAGMKVDGFDGERVYEFQGCYYHGCPNCYPYKREEPLKEDPSDSLHLRYERTKTKIQKLSETAYEIVEMWECEFKKIKRDNNLSYLNSLPILNFLPLEPRNAFFGGRTGNAKTYHKCEDGESIQYVDVCSLYPYVCKRGHYPLGHPTVHVGDRACRELGLEVNGILKCKVLPPLKLYHPVLPARMSDKLMFVLCRKCGEQLNQEDCHHSSEERALTGTWTMDEIRKAVDKGYVILDMYEMWEYKMATYENGGLFTDFIDKFLKIKQEASGYPSWCETPEDKEKYVKDYKDHEGVSLDPAKIEKNSGLRSLAKLMLNSFWGKFGQRENQTKASLIRNPKDFFTLMITPGIQVNTIRELNENVLLVNWQNIDEVGESLRTVNVVLAAFTTAQARLKLYEHLEALGGQVIYYDTDSVLYIYKQNLYRIPTGDYLGEMTDELAEYGPGSYIVEFVSGGPKTYAYLVFSTNKNALVEVCKIKGLTLNLNTSKKLNFAQLKEMVLSEARLSVETTESRIRRTKDKNIITTKVKKLFRVTGPKRRLEGTYDTLPYGYQKNPRLT
ncbi:uncharacterized protein LOC129003084 [Macrosteles quadrilineatus]|uniref:uncharacterized protein LOC129003084 n=1 Tax=Macrosteles quadrilineatus TaxID=74068 RepID=UPI0023E2D885|nr:uncharacterized protein LOC129003084 [Macrosteles quadrilineatus]